MTNTSYRFPPALRWIHAGLAVFGITAFLTGELAEDTGQALTAGYWLHAYLGLTLLVFLLGRIAYGFISPDWSIRGWWHGKTPFKTAIREDVQGLLRLRLPARSERNGIAGLVQSLGILIFLWMALTGTVLFFTGGPESSAFAHTVAETHEVGEYLVPVFLTLHIGAVILHTLSGHALLKRMNPLAKQVLMD